MDNEKYEFSKEWRVLKQLAEGNGLESLEHTQLDASLNRKIYWFLFNGAGGVLTLIKEIYGDHALKIFYEFLDYFLATPDRAGHYYHSDTIKSDIETIRFATQGLDFEKYLANLKKELIANDKSKGRD